MDGSFFFDDPYPLIEDVSCKAVLDVRGLDARVRPRTSCVPGASR